MFVTVLSVLSLPLSATSASEPSPSYASVYTGGEPDFSWYGTALDGFENHVPADPNKTEYTLMSAEQLAAFAHMVGYEFNQFRGITIKLGVDIVWNTGKFTVDEKGNPLYNGEPAVAGENVFEWEPIGDRDACRYGTSSTPQSYVDLRGQFFGSFDGQGHTVSGLFYETWREAYVGFFSVFCGRELKNLSIVNSYFSGHSRNGSFAGHVVGTVSSGENQDIVSSKFENLYSNAIIIVNGKTENNSRSGGIFGMCRPIPKNTYADDDDPAQNGWKIQLNQCWFDGTIWALHTTKYNGGLVGVAAMDDNASNRLNSTNPDDGKAHVIEYNNCLVTAVINNCPESASVSKTSAISIGLIQGGIYRGEVIMNNCVVNLRDTNINENTEVTKVNNMGMTEVHKFLPPMKDVTNAETGETTQVERQGKGIVGYYESLPCNVTYSNVFFAPIGYFTENNPTTYVPAVQGTTDMQNITGEAKVDEGLLLAAEALASYDCFRFVSEDGKLTARLVGIKTSVDPIDPDAVPPVYPSQTTTLGTTTAATGVAGSMVVPKTTPPQTESMTKPSTNQKEKDDRKEKKGCSSFSVFAAISTVAVGAAVTVIKKKD